MLAGLTSLFQTPEAPPGSYSTSKQWSDPSSTYIPLDKGGRYLLDKTNDGFIGKGASALVYRGRDQETKIGEGHMVAIKASGLLCHPGHTQLLAPPLSIQTLTVPTLSESPLISVTQVIDTGRLTEDALQREIELVKTVPKHRNIVEFFHTEEASSSYPPPRCQSLCERGSKTQPPSVP